MLRQLEADAIGPKTYDIADDDANRRFLNDTGRNQGLSGSPSVGH